jgi:hypothetical protein
VDGGIVIAFVVLTNNMDAENECIGVGADAAGRDAVVLDVVVAGCTEYCIELIENCDETGAS